VFITATKVEHITTVDVAACTLQSLEFLELLLSSGAVEAAAQALVAVCTQDVRDHLAAI